MAKFKVVSDFWDIEKDEYIEKAQSLMSLKNVPRESITILVFR